MVVKAIAAYLVTELRKLIRDFVESGISVVNDILAHISPFAEEGYAHCVVQKNSSPVREWQAGPSRCSARVAQ